MKNLIAGLLVGLGFAVSSTPANADPTAEKVQAFATAFLDINAQARLKDPLKTDYEFRFDDDPAEMTPDLWGRALLEELLEWSDRGMWLDWKYNVLTLIEDDDWSNIVGSVFQKWNAADLTDDERRPILANSKQLYGDRPEKFTLPDIQPLAEKRGLRLMIIDNQSDGLLLFALPAEHADIWHLTQFGLALMIDAAKGTVSDPRRDGKTSVLAD